MARIKIKHRLDPNDRQTKQKLLETLAQGNINICNLITTRDGSIVAVTATENDADLLLKTNMINTLQKEGFEPILPPEVRARRTIICYGIDELIYDHSKNDIEDEIEEKNPWAIVKNCYKFPPANKGTQLIKIEFEDAAMATKAEESGLRLFNMSIAGHQIKREKYTQLKTCMRCYKIEEHTTAQCPQPQDFKVCSECASQDHTWRHCKSNQKKCVNCGQGHRTLAMACPKRKEALKEAQQTFRNNQGNYAKVASANINNDTPKLNTVNITDNVTTMLFCLYSAHMMNAVQPGSFQQHLDILTTANKLPRLIGHESPPSKEIVQTVFGNTIPQTNLAATQSNLEDEMEEHNQIINKDTEEIGGTVEALEVPSEVAEDEDTTHSNVNNTQETLTTPKTGKSNNRNKTKDHSQNNNNKQQTRQKPSIQLQQHILQQNQATHEQTKEPRDPRLRYRQQ